MAISPVKMLKINGLIFYKIVIFILEKKNYNGIPANFCAEIIFLLHV